MRLLLGCDEMVATLRWSLNICSEAVVRLGGNMLGPEERTPRVLPRRKGVLPSREWAGHSYCPVNGDEGPCVHSPIGDPHHNSRGGGRAAQAQAQVPPAMPGSGAFQALAWVRSAREMKNKKPFFWGVFALQ